MDAITCIKERRSVRKFEEKKIPHEVMEELVEVASYAPSWKNTQIVRYIVLEDKEKIERIAQDCVLGFEYNTKTMKNAAALVLVTMVKGRCGYEKDGSFSTPKEDRWEMFDAGIATQTFCLAAHEKGIGSVIIGVFDESKVEEVVFIPEGQQLAAIIAVGYPSVIPDIPKRKSVEDLVSFK
ncbi:nitroreductase family protein [Clostridium aminobutyricum]|uniref:Nitroreductase family protein n=1 Tax=Clostridium aminobutyricum TaxID=33953 RepID=A0A939D7P1_CLOAM|nr:nitroreductase family protein [Clostridium aminobutyricum]MBN7772580.1 nitroreductase family protein [Clostridium aminobutyricum]